MATTNLFEAVMKGLVAMGLIGSEPTVAKQTGVMEEPAVTAQPVATVEPAFLRLSPEIQLMIYELVLKQTFRVSYPGNVSKTQAQPSENTQTSQNTQITQGNHETRLSKKINAIALLEVNRLIHSEARLLPFKNGKFTVVDYYTWYMNTSGDLSYLKYCNDVMQSLLKYQWSEIRCLELCVDKRQMKMFLWREYNLAMRSRDEKKHGFRKLFTIMAQLDGGYGGPAMVAELGSWVRERLEALTALETVSIGGLDVEVR